MSAGPIIAESRRFRAVLEAASSLAPSPRPVLILGETGVGKGRLAKWIHAQGPRGKHPFEVLNCGAVPDSLLHAELFGHVKGAFTGAVSSSPGRIRAAAEGVLFLDEIGDLSLRAQAALLHVLDGDPLRPLGGGEPIRLKARIVAATNRDLEADVERGRFRQDLYMRITSHELTVPPLRERHDDILPLAEEMLDSLKRDAGVKANLVIGPRAREALLAYPWPGNVREVHNVMAKAFYAPRRTPQLDAIAEVIAGRARKSLNGTASSGANEDRATTRRLEEAPGRAPSDLEEKIVTTLEAAERAGEVLSISKLAYRINRSYGVVRLAVHRLRAADLVRMDVRGRGSSVSLTA